MADLVCFCMMCEMTCCSAMPIYSKSFAIEHSWGMVTSSSCALDTGTYCFHSLTQRNSQWPSHETLGAPWWQLPTSFPFSWATELSSTAGRQAGQLPRCLLVDLTLNSLRQPVGGGGKAPNDDPGSQSWLLEAQQWLEHQAGQLNR